MRSRRPRLITCGRVITPAADLVPGTVEIADGRIVAVRKGAARGADVTAPSGILAPGFIDIQINGAAGVDFVDCGDPSELMRVRAYLASTGTTGFVPTLITSPLPRLRAALLNWGRLAAIPGGPRVLGVHLEGPYLSRPFKGAHDPRYLRRPDPEEATRLLDVAPGLVRLVTLAPELPGAGRVIAMLVRYGCVVSAGHTAATYDEARHAFAGGVHLVTHLYNAMRGLHHRDPGIVPAALEHPEVTVSLIVDFVHVHPAMLRLPLVLKGWRRVALITDAIAAAGAPRLRSPRLCSGQAGQGRGRMTKLAGRRVRVTDAPRLPGGRLAGSVLAMDEAVRNVVRLGIPLRDAVLMASQTPARVLGRLDVGRIAVGAVADLVLFDRRLRVSATYAGGEHLDARG